jgi:hypothetical protein
MTQQITIRSLDLKGNVTVDTFIDKEIIAIHEESWIYRVGSLGTIPTVNQYNKKPLYGTYVSGSEWIVSNNLLTLLIEMDRIKNGEGTPILSDGEGL